ncbi:hypothetical protein VTN00DRAFT_2925 [Thermoascus crustaceus]|uniref:uncharacterized protein n=1 Tax=Thermoascus crustaceus TaxID=5088 RepID=UPI003742B946
MGKEGLPHDGLHRPEETAKEGKENSPPSELTPRARLALVGAFGSMFCTVGFLNAFGIFETYYKEYQLADKSEFTISWIGAINVFCIFSGSILTGPLIDISGPQVMFYLGSLGTVFSIMMTSLCKELYQFILAQGILLGISMTLICCPMVAIISQHFQRQRAAAVGMVIAGSSLGGVIWPIVVHELLQKAKVRFGWTMRIVGFIMLPILGVSCISARPPAANPAAPDKESRSGSGSSESTAQDQLRENDNSTQTDNKTGQKKSLQKIDWSILRSPVLHLTCFGFFIVYFGMFAPFFFTTSYAVSEGFSDNLSFYTISIINGASLFGRILPGIVADRYGKFNCCILATGFSGIIALCWTSVTTVAGLVVWSAAYGFSSGAILSLQQACAAQIATPSTIGTVIGTVMASTSLSALAGTPISGELAGKYGFLALSIYAGVSLLVGTAILVVARLAQERRLLAAV